MEGKNYVYELLYGNYDIRIYHKIREQKEKQINDFVKANESALRQRSDEWFFMRNSVIGASELAALVGMSPRPNDSIRSFQAGGGTTNSSSRTKPRLGPSDK